MFYLDVATDGRKETLRFASRNDAINFANFVKAYVDDSGAGNGYGAYWCELDAKPYWRPGKLRDSGAELDPEIMSQMFAGILRARLATNDTLQPSQFPSFLHGGRWCRSIHDTGIMFLTLPLPPRQRPAVGDMYRIPRSLLNPDGSDFSYSEGRVLSDHDGILTVRACQDEDSATGEWRNEKKPTYTVAADRAMKINDWLLTLRIPPPQSSGK